MLGKIICWWQGYHQFKKTTEWGNIVDKCFRCGKTEPYSEKAKVSGCGWF